MKTDLQVPQENVSAGVEGGGWSSDAVEGTGISEMVKTSGGKTAIPPNGKIPVFLNPLSRFWLFIASQ